MAMLLVIAAYPATGRAQVACLGPVSGPTAYCPDCIYDTYGEEDPSKLLDDFACAQFTNLRGLGGNPTSAQFADPFLVEGGNYRLESATIRLRLIGMPMLPGDVVVRVWDDDDVLGNDNPEDPQSFADNQPGNVLARAVIAQEGVTCVGTTITQDRCDETASFDETPILQDGVTYWVGAAMTDALTSVSWVQTTGETVQQPECAGPNCSDEWVIANTNAEMPAWNPAPDVDPVGLVRLVPEPCVALLRGGALATLLALWAVRQRRGLTDSREAG
jgi:hypothetical protein